MTRNKEPADYGFEPHGLTARHLRLNLSFAHASERVNDFSAPDKDDDLEGSPLEEPDFIPNHFNFANNAPARRLTPVRCCIYCGSTDFAPNSNRPLSDEHIVAEGLGGSLILPEASCESCAVKTTKIEGAVLRTLLWAPRHVAKIRMKRRKREERGFPVNATIDGVERTIFLPLEYHPTLLFFPVLNPPGILINRDERESGVQGVWALELNSVNKITSLGIKEFTSPVLDTVRFGQMLAKIAHGIAVAAFGYGSFKPLLTDFILREFGKAEQYPELFHLIGGTPLSFPPSEHLHVLGVGSDLDDGNRVIIAIRLFAHYGAPIFHVVAGELTSKAR